MKIKTAELQGAALDWAVARCENALWLKYENALLNETTTPPHPSEFLRNNGFHPDKFKPSTDWSQGGPIIERERVAFDADGKMWIASLNHRPICYYGSTPLVAAMRCFVASRLGDEVEIPEELLS